MNDLEWLYYCINVNNTSQNMLRYIKPDKCKNIDGSIMDNNDLYYTIPINPLFVYYNNKLKIFMKSYTNKQFKKKIKVIGTNEQALVYNLVVNYLIDKTTTLFKWLYLCIDIDLYFSPKKKCIYDYMCFKYVNPEFIEENNIFIYDENGIAITYYAIPIDPKFIYRKQGLDKLMLLSHKYASSINNMSQNKNNDGQSLFSEAIDVLENRKENIINFITNHFLINRDDNIVKWLCICINIEKTILSNHEFVIDEYIDLMYIDLSLIQNNIYEYYNYDIQQNIKYYVIPFDPNNMNMNTKINMYLSGYLDDYRSKKNNTSTNPQDL